MARFLSFYELAVYRLSKEKYEKQLNTHIEQHPLFSKEREPFHKRNPDIRIAELEDVKKEYGGPWRHNEIIGYIRLYFDSYQVLGHYYVNDVKRHVKTRRKLFRYSTYKLAPQVDLPIELCNKGIYQAIKVYIEDCKKELPGRYIDSELFELVGPYIDWKELLLSSSNSHYDRGVLEK